MIFLTCDTLSIYDPQEGASKSCKPEEHEKPRAMDLSLPLLSSYLSYVHRALSALCLYGYQVR